MAIVDGIVLLIPITVFAVVTPLLVHGPGSETATRVFIIFVFLVVFIFQMVLITEEGQTVGKKSLGIRIVKMDTGQNGGFVPNVLLRLIVNGLIGVIPFYGLVGILFIFRGDCRCIHYLSPGTQVVDA